MGLIDADELKEKAWDAKTQCGYVQVVDVGDIDDAPTIEERKKGKWVPFSPKSHLYSCSLCGQWADRHWNYCPDCGARMEDKE